MTTPRSTPSSGAPLARQVRLLTGRGNVYSNGALPLATSGTTFEPWQGDAPTSGSVYLGDSVSRITKTPVVADTMDNALITTLDTRIATAFSPQDWVAVARTLKLDIRP